MELSNDARLLLVLLSILGLFIGSVFAVAYTSHDLPTAGSLIQTIGIEVEENQVNWGLVEPSSTYSRIVHVRNSGTATMKLVITVMDWQPTEVQQYLAFSSPDNETLVNAQETQSITLTLSVSPIIHDIDTFSFNIHLAGEEQ